MQRNSVKQAILKEFNLLKATQDKSISLEKSISYLEETLILHLDTKTFEDENTRSTYMYNIYQLRFFLKYIQNIHLVSRETYTFSKSARNVIVDSIIRDLYSVYKYDYTPEVFSKIEFFLYAFIQKLNVKIGRAYLIPISMIRYFRNVISTLLSQKTEPLPVIEKIELENSIIKKVLIVESITPIEHEAIIQYESQENTESVQSVSFVEINKSLQTEKETIITSPVSVIEKVNYIPSLNEYRYNPFYETLCNTANESLFCNKLIGPVINEAKYFSIEEYKHFFLYQIAIANYDKCCKTENKQRYILTEEDQKYYRISLSSLSASEQSNNLYIFIDKIKASGLYYVLSQNKNLAKTFLPYENIKVTVMKEYRENTFYENISREEFIDFTQEYEHRLFWKLQECIDSVKEKNRRAFYSIICENYKMRYFHSDLPITYFKRTWSHITFCEIINNCKFFCDIDDHNGEYTKEEFLNIAKLLKIEFPEMFKSYYNIPINHINMLITVNMHNQRPRNSARFFAQVISKDNKIFYFEKPSQQIDFWVSFIKKFPKLEPFIDFHVYRNNSPLRFWKCCKFMEEYTNHTPSISDIYSITGGKLLPRKITQQMVSSEESFKEIDSVIIACEKPSKETHLLLKPKRINMKKYITAYEAKIALEAMKNAENPVQYEGVKRIRIGKAICDEYTQVRKFDRRDKWTNFIRFIKCLFWSNSEEDNLNIINSFMARHGWDSITAFAENKELYKSIRAFPRTLDSFLDFLEMKEINYDNIYCKNIVEYMPIEKPEKIKLSPEVKFNKGYVSVRESIRKIQLVCSPCDTQKTRQIFLKYSHLKMLFINYRISLTKDILDKDYNKELKIISYQDEEAMKDIYSTGNIPDILSIQLESLYKIREYIDKFDLVFIDEFPLVLAQFENSRRLKCKYNEVCETFRYIMNTKNIIAASANINFHCLKFIRSFVGEEKIYTSLNTFVSKHWTIKTIETPYMFLKKTESLILTDKKKVIIPTNSKKAALEIYLYLHSKGIKALLITADTVKSTVPVNDLWIQYECVIYTSTIESGVSFTPVHFDHIAGFFINKSTNHLAAFQMLIRCRNPISDTHFIYAQNNMIVSDKKGKSKVLKKSYITEQAIKMEINAREKMSIDNELFEEIDFEESFNQNIIYNKLYTNYSQLAFKDNLQRECISQGMIWNSVERLKNILGHYEDELHFETEEQKKDYFKKLTAANAEFRKELKSLVIAYYIAVLVKAGAEYNSKYLNEIDVSKSYKALKRKYEYNIDMTDFARKHLDRFVKLSIINPENVEKNVTTNINMNKSELYWYKLAYISLKGLENNPITGLPFELYDEKDKMLILLIKDMIGRNILKINEDHKPTCDKIEEDDMHRNIKEILTIHSDSILGVMRYNNETFLKNLNNQTNNLRTLNSLLKECNLRIERCAKNKNNKDYNKYIITKHTYYTSKSPYLMNVLEYLEKVLITTEDHEKEQIMNKIELLHKAKKTIDDMIELSNLSF